MPYTKKCPNCADGVIHHRGSLQCRKCHIKEVSPWKNDEEKKKHHQERQANWFQQNKKRIYKKRKKHHKENPEFWKERYFKYHLKRFYGLTYETYLEMVRSQNSKCLICGNHNEKLHVDHNHITKQVRGLLCFNCNGGLGQFKDNLTNIKNAVQYMERYETGNNTNTTFNSAAS